MEGKNMSKYVAPRGLAVAAGLVLALAGCTGGDTTPKTKDPLEPEFIELSNLGEWAMILPAGADPASFTGWAKKRCGAAPICGVQAWGDRASAARAMPMTDTEVASRAFSYRVNRNTGFEQSLWNCEQFPRPDRANCL